MSAISLNPGTILKIKARSFVSYNDMEFIPVQTLNILLAPNGAGKSSLLSAIILGLGGKPNIIGKSNKISDFIMHGKEEAVIHIDLCDPQSDDNVLYVRREIKKNCTSVWFLNNKQTTQKQVDAAMKRLNIQVDNLCQILPQERVQDFAKMNSLQLLENVQSVIGNDLYSDYHQLLESRHTLISKKKYLEQNGRLRQDEIAKYQRLEKDVAAVQEQQRVLKSVVLCRQKLAWTLYNNSEQEQIKVSGYVKEAKNKVSTFEKDFEPLKTELESIEQKRNSVNEVAKRKKNKVCSVEEEMRKLMNQVKLSQSQIGSIKENLQRHIQDASNNKSLVEDLDVKIQELAKQLEQQNDRELTREVSELDHTIREKVTELQALAIQHNEMKQMQVATSNTVKVLESKLERAKGVGQKRMQMVAMRNQDVGKGFQWLCQNRDKFQSNVYGPLVKELNIINSDAAKYIEFIIPFRDLISFVTESSQDMTNLLRKLRDNEKLNVNCAHCSPPTSHLQDLFPPKVSYDQIRQLGFDCYLVDLVEGPPTIIKHLCTLCKIHLIPVAFSQKSINADVVSRLGISAYFIGNEFYSVKVSRYSKNSSTSVISVRPSVLLADSLDRTLIQQTQIELNAKRESLQELEFEVSGVAESRSSVEVKLNELRNQKKAQSLKLEHYRSTTVRLRRHEEERSRLAKDMMFNQQKEERNADHKIKEIIELNISRMKKISEFCKAYTEASTSVKLYEIDLRTLKHMMESKKKQLSQHEDSRNKLKNDVEMLNKSLVEVKAVTSNLLMKAKDLTEGLMMGEARFTKQYGKRFNSLSNDVDAIRSSIQKFEAKARCLDNPLQEQHLKDYESAKSKAESLEVELKKLSDEIYSLEENIQMLKSRWLPPIDQIATNLNATFSTFFNKMGCVGEVRLDKTDNEEAIENYGLEIRVKFRNDTNLQVLDQFIQSGGERALTTAVFLLSLQRQSSLPFRCVDEINQGMDQFNERRIYNLLFNTVSDDSSQYFLLTPKFLKGVTFPNKCTIFGIFNCCPADMSDDPQCMEDKENRHTKKRRKYEDNSVNYV